MITVDEVRTTLANMKRIGMIPGPYIFRCSCGVYFPVSDDEDTVEKIHSHVIKHYGPGVRR